ncbi:hypothetical protein WA026_021507 [Henosepilachna vigintioctopunctata]|uniref:B box-type domain-containing protein n=1 Tax=Henosepilachna vigintioctopunctata TaxID=420089 RepID=A0AAW1VBA0_9CUCU
MEEVALDDKSSKYLRKDVSNSKGKDEMVDSASSADMLPWCVLCNNDAQFRCLDCGGDLYCEKCNREVHKEWDRDHQVVPFGQK